MKHLGAHGYLIMFRIGWEVFWTRRLQKTEEIQMSGEHLSHPEWEGEEVGLDVYKVRVAYEFSCYDENEQEAEGFSNYCVKGVRSKLEELGYRMECISSKAEDMDMGWLDELESMVFR